MVWWQGLETRGGVGGRTEQGARSVCVINGGIVSVSFPVWGTQVLLL